MREKELCEIKQKGTNKQENISQLFGQIEKGRERNAWIFRVTGQQTGMDLSTGTETDKKNKVNRSVIH